MSDPPGGSEGQHHEGRGEGRRTGLAQPEEKTGILLLSPGVIEIVEPDSVFKGTQR